MPLQKASIFLICNENTLRHVKIQRNSSEEFLNKTGKLKMYQLLGPKGP